VTSDRKLAIFRTELRRLAAEKRRRRNPRRGKALSQAEMYAEYEKVLQDDIAARTRSGDSEGAAGVRRLLARLRAEKAHRRINPSHSYGCSCFGCR
jgi:hypothetical protein